VFKLIALALHFGSYYQGPIDPIVVKMLGDEADRRAEKKNSNAENVVALTIPKSTTEPRKAA
jgi:hypothetical protein